MVKDEEQKLLKLKNAEMEGLFGHWRYFGAFKEVLSKKERKNTSPKEHNNHRNQPNTQLALLVL